ncbi:hypothetical protein [Sphingomonas bacterium]|uniref:hypothetical protein n=1 Tax=Sphingomonas bacterium TaxID=1895847 RepID=UPI00157559F0|nr:hypothetical protein [Sphingomonas bacterium]
MEARCQTDETRRPAVARLDPALEPAPGAAAERRLHGRAHAYWRSLLGARRFPLIDDLDLAGVPRLAETSLLFAVDAREGEPAVNLVGASVRAAWAGPESAMARLIAQVRLRLPVLAAHRKPLGFEAELSGAASGDTVYRGILLPFGRIGERVEHVLMVVNWKERAAIERDPALLAASLYAASRTRLAPLSSPWEGAEAPAKGLPPASLEQKLASARMWAALPPRDHANKALVAAYEYLLGAESQTPLGLIASVYGSAVDRRTRSDLAATLHYARRLCLSPTLLLDLLDDLGGATEVAALERRVRRARSSSDPQASDHFLLTEPVQPRERSQSPWRGREAESVAVEHQAPRARAAKD